MEGNERGGGFARVNVYRGGSRGDYARMHGTLRIDKRSVHRADLRANSRNS